MFAPWGRLSFPGLAGLCGKGKQMRKRARRNIAAVVVFSAALAGCAGSVSPERYTDGGEPVGYYEVPWRPLPLTFTWPDVPAQYRI